MPETILSVTVEREPQILPEVTRALNRAHVHVQALSFAPHDEGWNILLLTDDADNAFEALRTDGFLVERVTALLLDVSTEPGDYAQYLQDIIGVGVDVSCALHTRDGRLVVGVDDYDKAVDAVQGAAIVTG